MNWSEYKEKGTNAAGAEAMLWQIKFNGREASVAIETSLNFLFSNTAFDITPEVIGSAYLDATTDFPEKTPRELGRVIYQYAAKSVYGPRD